MEVIIGGVFAVIGMIVIVGSLLLKTKQLDDANRAPLPVYRDFIR